MDEELTKLTHEKQQLVETVAMVADRAIHARSTGGLPKGFARHVPAHCGLDVFMVRSEDAEALRMLLAREDWADGN